MVIGPFGFALPNKSEILGPNFQNRNPNIIAKTSTIIIIFFTSKVYLNSLYRLQMNLLQYRRGKKY